MRLFYLSHPEVVIDPAVPVPDWGLSPVGIARLQALAARGWPAAPVRIVSSPEAKARQTAVILALPLGVPVEVHARTGEIDRSATGYVPHARHEALADAFFAQPEVSAEGWERAVDAQARMVAALDAILAVHPGGDLLMVGHGGVGTLLWCALTGRAIARAEDQPFGGHVWACTLSPVAPLHPWRAVEML